MTMIHSDQEPATNRFWALPDPATSPEIYEDVPTKRLFAWILDVIAISAITAVLTVFSLFTALFVLPAVFAMVSFVYRWATLARSSATPGMRLMSLEMRRADGSEFDGLTALLHTTGYFVSIAMFPAQIISIIMMLMTERRQGLTDMILGTAALNRSTA